MAYSKGIIAIPNVTGNIEITVATTEVSGYTNLFDQTADGFELQSDTKFMTNYIPCSLRDIIHIKGATPYKYQRYNKNKTAIGTLIYCTNAGLETASYDANVKTFLAGQTDINGTVDNVELGYVRMEFRVAVPSELIITVNQNIIDE